MTRIISIAFCFLSLFFSISQASEVYLKGPRGSWYLEVDGKPFYIKGAGCGYARGKDGTDFLKLAKELGANAVRTWGTDQGTKEYLDAANSYGLKVTAGIWLNYVTGNSDSDYLNDSDYKIKKRKEALEYVKRFKNHPAILMWGVGNEVISSTNDPQVRIAICRFMEELIQAIHKIDPSHPVTYASKGTTDLQYLKDYVPSLDIIGMNMYRSIHTAHGAWELLAVDKPYIFTEYGHPISLYMPKDNNGCSIELSDKNKAKIYANAVLTIFSSKGYNLGGFAFNMGEVSQSSMTWHNLNEGKLKRESFWRIYELYTEKKAPYELAVIKNLSISKTKDLKPQELVEASVVVEEGEGKNLTYSYALSGKAETEAYYVNEYIPMEVSGKGDHISFKAPSEKGVYRFYCFVKDGQGNVTSANKSISVK
jgi:hypothetical protein